MLKTITTHLERQFTVMDDGTAKAVIVETKNTHSGAEIAARLLNHDAIDLGEAVLKSAGKKVFTYEGSLPGVGVDGDYFVAGQGGDRVERHTGASSESVLKQIKGLIAIHNKIVKEEEYRKTEEFKKAEAEKKLNARRNELTQKFCNDDPSAGYRYLSETAKKAVDYAIELEDKLGEKSEPLAQWEIDLLNGGKDN